MSSSIRFGHHSTIEEFIATFPMRIPSLWQQQSSLTVNLVNLTNPMLMRGSFREWMPVGQQIVRIRLPHGKPPQKVRLLWSGVEPETRYDASGRLEVVVPAVEAIEVIALDF